VDGGGRHSQSPPPLVLPTPKRSFPFPVSLSSSSAPASNQRSAPVGGGMRGREKESGRLEITNVFSLGTSTAGTTESRHHRLLSSLLQQQQQQEADEPGPAPAAPIGGGSPETGNTTNTCEICGKGFTLRTNLTAHKKLHVRGATTCKWCSKTLSTIGNLRCVTPTHD